MEKNCGILDWGGVNLESLRSSEIAIRTLSREIQWPVFSYPVEKRNSDISSTIVKPRHTSIVDPVEEVNETFYLYLYRGDLMILCSVRPKGRRNLFVMCWSSLDTSHGWILDYAFHRLASFSLFRRWLTRIEKDSIDDIPPCAARYSNHLNLAITRKTDM
jgi:hypothetical protein